jgi:hypothetical protein
MRVRVKRLNFQSERLLKFRGSINVPDLRGAENDVCGGPAYRSANVVPNASANEAGVERPGQTCAAAIHQKHPELKGKSFSTEWGKCKADPAGYLKANT